MFYIKGRSFPYILGVLHQREVFSVDTWCFTSKGGLFCTYLVFYIKGRSFCRYLVFYIKGRSFPYILGVLHQREVFSLKLHCTSGGWGGGGMKRLSCLRQIQRARKKEGYETQMKGNSLCCCLSPSSASKSLSSDEIFS